MSTEAESPGEPESPPADEFVYANVAARLTGLPEKRIKRAGELGLLTIRRPPPGLGGVPRYSRASCLALRDAMVIPARASLADLYSSSGGRP